MMCCESAALPDMGLGAGGRMEQRIHPDEHAGPTWDRKNAATVNVRIVDSRMWTAITGEAAPPSPVSAALYTMHGLPWFARYDEALGDIATPARLAGVRSVASMTGADAEDAPFAIDEAQVIGIGAGAG